MGYGKYSKKGQPFALVNPSFYPQVLLPPEQIGWLVSQPEHILSHEKANEDIHALPFLAPGFNNYAHLELIRAIRHDLTRNIANTEAAFRDELEHTASEALGHAGDSSWREVNLAETLDTIIFGVCLRIFFGPSLCRDAKYIHLVKTWTRVTGGLMIAVSQLVPWLLKPVVGLVAGLPIYYYWLRMIAFLYPTYKQRIVYLQTSKQCPPEDMVTWMVDLALKCNPGKTPSISALIVRLTLVLESAIRESLRLSPLSDRMLSRRVVQKGGIRLPDGQLLRHGTWIAVAATGIHRDECNYESPNEYRPFRFCSTEEKTGKPKASTPIPATSEKFLAFGHGRHSCPGRWFASYAMKVMIGYILVNYEIEPLDNRPSNSIVGQTIVPPLEVKIRVRRKTETECK
ncbi:cytochrome p450 [Hirsutella rhossiliensis]|uniref:Cytochrome p450 domain-containing protein n=1 Tax=Hirsutella rhossiliensis TaxID=111463 RepID=A0A9P8MND2_9HYPO|nr:cytochrome p450 domain-containing protein [Hirsutella rhossiliensis]KAH0958315.1 cytochrome p450 domain-containing protein [Hirsutella rhossiliensis]